MNEEGGDDDDVTEVATQRVAHPSPMVTTTASRRRSIGSSINTAIAQSQQSEQQLEMGKSPARPLEQVVDAAPAPKPLDSVQSTTPASIVPKNKKKVRHYFICYL